jgi:hypothetical protein
MEYGWMTEERKACSPFQQLYPALRNPQNPLDAYAPPEEQTDLKGEIKSFRLKN